MTTLRRYLATAALVACAASALAACGDDDEGTVRSELRAGPYIVSPESLREELKAAGAEMRSEGRPPALARRSLPLPRRSDVLVGAEGTRLSVLFYRGSSVALTARASVRDAVGEGPEILKVENVLVVVDERGPELPEIRDALRRLAEE